MLVCPAILWTLDGLLYFWQTLCLIFWACNVPWQMLLSYFRQMFLPYFRQMLLPWFCVVDVTTTRQMLQPVTLPIGRYYCHHFFVLWQMLLPQLIMWLMILPSIHVLQLLCGRCYCQGGRWNSLPWWAWRC